ncbi:hypothetical protein P3342_011292 [Pyrenophora teres f. teres]|uniref:Methyltransf-25 multi-domain protein n=1 Tax=Pyrenophora teres f. teres TaxID=97479 RepID=A0A6S6WC09_9PLEO|nr:hypothetical protein HRS9139_06124 [Pyrenophora teres f. teres]KAK1909213.1 hypothetical protein P3342_011292 [Pyrenophora teres f. teres]CAE7207007.1 Methyltransf-25 multi-domain protein [Pyrenophora teres f. teres]
MAAVSNDLACQNFQKESSERPNWFDPDPTIDAISPDFRRLLQSYSGIPADELLDHVVKVREEAWAIHPFPCIGRFLFLQNNFKGLEDEYNEVIQRLCQGQKLLDMACCVGQTIRYLVNGGAPSEQIYGCDLHPEYIEVGYKLFRDRGTLKTKFLTADVFDSNSALSELKGQMDMVFAGDFFHLWGYEKQVDVCKRVASLLRSQPGSMILGRQVGAPQAFETQGPPGVGVMFLHNVESFNKMWKDIGDELGVSFTVKTWFGLLPTGKLVLKKDDACRLSFAVRID